MCWCLKAFLRQVNLSNVIFDFLKHQDVFENKSGTCFGARKLFRMHRTICQSKLSATVLQLLQLIDLQSVYYILKYEYVNHKQTLVYLRLFLLAGLTSGCKRVKNHVHSRACWTLDRNCGHFTSKCVLQLVIQEKKPLESTVK